MRIAIVNDLRLAVEAIRRAVIADGRHTVAWTAADGAEAVEKCARDRPDLLLMDMIMPGLDGVEATKRIMAASPCAILVVTAVMQGDPARVFEALGAGALDAVQTPEGVAGAAMLKAKIDSLERVLGETRRSADPFTKQSSADAARVVAGAASHLVAIGSSAGGPAALAEVLGALPATFPAAVVIVQHIDAQFARGLAEWLGTRCRLPVRLAEDRDWPVAGEVRVAPGDRHLVMCADGKLGCCSEPRAAGYLPSVDVFFDSVARHWQRGATGVLLTGMGRDGAAGLLRLNRAGFTTIAQDRLTSAVYGMPKAAAELGAAREILPLPLVASRLVSLASAGAPLPRESL